MKHKSQLLILAAVVLTTLTACSSDTNVDNQKNNEQYERPEKELPTVYEEGKPGSTHDEYDKYKTVNAKYKSCRNDSVMVNYQKTVKDGTGSFDHSYIEQGAQISKEAMMQMLYDAGFVKKSSLKQKPESGLSSAILDLIAVALVLLILFLLFGLIYWIVSLFRGPRYAWRQGDAPDHVVQENNGGGRLRQRTTTIVEDYD